MCGLFKGQGKDKVESLELKRTQQEAEGSHQGCLCGST